MHSALCLVRRPEAASSFFLLERNILRYWQRWELSPRERTRGSGLTRCTVHTHRNDEKT